MNKNTAKKNAAMTAAIYGILFLVYNILVFLIFKEKNGVFWMSYVFGVLAFIVQFASMYFALSSPDMEAVFYGIPLASLSLYYFFAAMFASVVFMIFKIAPFKLALIVQLLILAAYAVAALLALLSRNTVQDINNTVRDNAAAIHRLNVDVDMLIPQAKDPAVRKALQRVSETVKYSDPMSNEHVVQIEDQIMRAVNDLQVFVGYNDNEKAIQACRHIEMLFLQRNRTLKATK
ncbi:MAG: hypothetical protein Q4B22_09505 [Eubacteriales bacterium]|nr:hypothetical protein [Eubacteriales bacterium]